MRLILASTSPRRRELLASAGYPFEVIAPAAEAEQQCGICTSTGPASLVVDLALRKAADVVGRLAEEAGRRPAAWVVVACDTVAECQGEILGKPADRDHAGQMLRRLRGSVHRVYSGLCVWPSGEQGGASRHRGLEAAEPDTEVQSSQGVPILQRAVSELEMDPFDDDALETYLDSGLWEGKAGAFGLQDRPGWIRLVSGSESNVVGLPMEMLQTTLDRLGVSRR